ncbi:MAG: DNA-directed RNA polymerase subunit D [Nanoarchaeota archaeon]|nr:DNA-directed RNA polymerase subunit D [Nanoarchaeota archaeon]MBU1623045.1 DNA-directed RNA polymerase subunit D [Nanoarchaeota archaeon]MBU1974225.1 DNA-directed RNA polymerase subunit D [Nanoarchaeota archaeon]
MIKLEKIKEERKKNKLIFFFKGSDEVFVNTIRRLIIEEVPTLAVEDIEIKDNGSALYDEMLGLRLGLCPIKTDLKSYNLKEKCKCSGEGCAQCELKINLKVAKKGYVKAEEAQSTDPKCNFVQPEMPITKLLAKQKVDLQMTAIMGNGRMHAKWSPGWTYFKKEPVLKVGKVNDIEKLKEACTDNVFDFKGSSVKVNQDQLYESNLLEYYTEIDSGITLDYTDNFIFVLESWGQLSYKEMLSQSAEILISKAEELEKLI